MSSSTNSIPSPLSIRTNTPDPLMDPELATLLCTTLTLCPGHIRGYTSQGFCSLEDIADTTMNTLHHFSQQHDHIDPYFPHHPQFGTAEFFSELLLLLQWATYYNRPLSDFNIDILDDLEINGTDSELRLHFEQLLHYSSESTTTTTPTIRDLHPTFLSPHNSHSQHTSTTTSTPIHNIQEYSSDDDTPTASTKPSYTPNSTTSSTPTHTNSCNGYFSAEDAIPTLHCSTIKPSPFPTSPPITSTINKIAASPSDDESTDHSSPTKTAFKDGFDTGVEAARDHDTYCDDRNNNNYEYDDNGYDNGGYNDTCEYNDGGYDNTCEYDDGGYDETCDYDDGGYDDNDPEPPPDW